MLGFGGGRGPDVEERLQPLRGRLQQVENEAEAALVAAIGKERLDELAREGLRRRGIRPTGVAATPDAGPGAGAGDAGSDGLPAPLAATDVQRVARALGVPQRAIPLHVAQPQLRARVFRTRDANAGRVSRGNESTRVRIIPAD